MIWNQYQPSKMFARINKMSRWLIIFYYIISWLIKLFILPCQQLTYIVESCQVGNVLQVLLFVIHKGRCGGWLVIVQHWEWLIRCSITTKNIVYMDLPLMYMVCSKVRLSHNESKLWLPAQMWTWLCPPESIFWWNQYLYSCLLLPNWYEGDQT